MRSFAGVDANVDRKSGSLDEGLAAVAELAGERSLLTVDPSVPVIVGEKMALENGQPGVRLLLL